MWSLFFDTRCVGVSKPDDSEPHTPANFNWFFRVDRLKADLMHNFREKGGFDRAD